MKTAFWIGVGIAILTAMLARRFPPLNTDEVFIANHGWNLVTGQGQRYSLYDDIFAPEVYAWREAFAQVSETLTNGGRGTRAAWIFAGARASRIAGRDHDPSSSREMASPVGWLAAWIGIALLVRKHEVPYALNLYPLMIPFIAIHLSRPRKNAPTWRILGRRKAGTSATLPGTLEIGTGSYGTFTLYRLS